MPKKKILVISKDETLIGRVNILAEVYKIILVSDYVQANRHLATGGNNVQDGQADSNGTVEVVVAEVDDKMLNFGMLVKIAKEDPTHYFRKHEYILYSKSGELSALEETARAAGMTIVGTVSEPTIAGLPRMIMGRYQNVRTG